MGVRGAAAGRGAGGGEGSKILHHEGLSDHSFSFFFLPLARRLISAPQLNESTTRACLTQTGASCCFHFVALVDSYCESHRGSPGIEERVERRKPTRRGVQPGVQTSFDARTSGDGFAGGDHAQGVLKSSPRVSTPTLQLQKPKEKEGKPFRLEAQNYLAPY